MHAVGGAADGDIHIVVDDEGHAVAFAQGPDLQRLGQKLFLIQFLFPQLNAGRAVLQRGLHLLRKAHFSCPRPVCHRVEQHGLFYRSSYFAPLSNSSGVK